MNSIELMKEEHRHILELLECMRSACCKVLDSGFVADEDFRMMIYLARSYADEHHHGKEEKILFPAMMEHLGPAAKKLIQNGMLVEHDLGRLHIMNLEAELDAYQAEPTTRHKMNIIAEAAGYANLLQRHIEKEDHVVYSFAERSLPKEVMLELQQKMDAFEAETEALRSGYLCSLNHLREKLMEVL